MIQAHVDNTGSAIGKEILDNFSEYLPKFKKIIPHDYSHMHDSHCPYGRKRSEHLTRHRLKHFTQAREDRRG